MTEPRRPDPMPSTRPQPAGAGVARRPSAPTPAPRRPYHIPVTIGLSAGLYAASLAGVTALQAAQDAAVAAQRDPAAAAIAQLQAHNDGLSQDLIKAGDAFDAAAGRYDAASQRLASLEQQLGRIAAAVGAVRSGSSAAKLPSVGRSNVAAPPPVSATTGASGKP
ncbi:MAG: hypothetical protein ACXWOT_09125 [Candidatus Limnocylindrales bacterium]